MRGRSTGNVISTTNGDAIPFSSNGVRLSIRQWLVVGVTMVALLIFLPRLWPQVEKFEPQADYRVPSDLSDDYWLYERYCKWACSRDKILVIGDSAIRGFYVPAGATLSHYFNELAGGDEFANLAVDGLHPVALFGLLSHYGRDISNKRIILHLNPLWMSSGKFDLQTDKEFQFHHPKLVPQFVPKIACYKESISGRIGTVVERYVDFFSWTSHLQKVYFQSMDLTAWTLEHPYRNPLSAITLEVPTAEHYNPAEHVSWMEKSMTKEDFDWVDLSESFQWRFFRRTVDMLRARGNKVFVLVGPFNEHILTVAGAETYSKMKSQIESWLQQKTVPYYIAPPLPSELYRDASHPLSKGYEMLAGQLFESGVFRTFLGEPATANRFAEDSLSQSR